MSGGFERVALFEHGFWLQILEDHSRFILQALSPAEEAEVQRAQYFINVFQQLLDETRTPLSGEELRDLTQQTYECAQALRVFKLDIQSRQLMNEIKINLTPTFINHMVNEVEDYLRILGSLSVSEVPPLCHPNYYHLLWLVDAAGHAFALISQLDMVEAALIDTVRDFMIDFGHLYLKAIEVQGYMRTSLRQFPVLNQFNHEVEETMKTFRVFLLNLKKAREEKKVLGKFSPLVPDHMEREECYYLTKLGQVSAVRSPDCDLARPRL